MKFKLENDSPWDLVDVADSVFNVMILGVAVLMVMYGVIEGSQALGLWA